MTSALAVSASSPVQLVLSRLKSHQRSGAGWMAQCPSHPDRNPSLKIDEGDAGGAVVHCHAGCSFEAIVSALGLEPRDLAPPSFGARPSLVSSSRIVATYDYRDENDDLLYQVVRKEPKSFLRRRPDPFAPDGWSWKVGATRRVLYRLADVIEAVALEKPIYIVEGEKDADRLASLGLCATTNAGGAGKWLPDYTEALRDATVTVLPDNDEPGRAHAAAIVAALTGVAAKVSVVTLPNLRPKGDVSEWLNAGGTLEELHRLATESDPATLIVKPQRFRLFTYTELAAIPPVPPLIETVLFRGGVSATVAPYDSYKSFIALDESLCIAHGLVWHGHGVVPGPTVYQAGEGAIGLPRRVEAWKALNGVPEIGGIHFLPRSVKMNDERDLADLLAILRGLPDRPVLLTIDTLARSLRGNENSVEDTGLYVEAVDAIRESIGCHVQLVHHAGWEGTRSRGSSNIPASLDTELTLDRDDGRVTITATKQKDAAPFAPITLQAIPVAGSIAFQRVAATSSELSEAERKMLDALPRGESLTAKAWRDAAAVKERTFYRAITRLSALAYTKQMRGKYSITDAGACAT